MTWEVQIRRPVAHGSGTDIQPFYSIRAYQYTTATPLCIICVPSEVACRASVRLYSQLAPTEQVPHSRNGLLIAAYKIEDIISFQHWYREPSRIVL